MRKGNGNIITLRNWDLGILCICALRYCMGRQTYVSELVRGIITPLLRHLPDVDIDLMLHDCDEQARDEKSRFGDLRIDKPGWIAWRSTVREEKTRRSEEEVDDGEL